MKKIKFAILGCGTIGDVHARAIQELDAAELFAVCDVNPERAKESFSAFLMAIFLGTSSPNTMLKNESNKVISTTNIYSGITMPLPLINPRELNQAQRGSEKVSAANADPKNPARVIAT